MQARTAWRRGCGGAASLARHCTRMKFISHVHARHGACRRACEVFHTPTISFGDRMKVPGDRPASLAGLINNTTVDFANTRGGALG
jgi:hypothetical protein